MAFYRTSVRPRLRQIALALMSGAAKKAQYRPFDDQTRCLFTAVAEYTMTPGASKRSSTPRYVVANGIEGVSPSAEWRGGSSAAALALAACDERRHLYLYDVRRNECADLDDLSRRRMAAAPTSSAEARRRFV
jgi:hypothetical protein